MKCLFFHCKLWKITVTKLSNRMFEGGRPEDISEKEQQEENCIVIFITVEINDEFELIYYKFNIDVGKMSNDVGTKNIVLLPFAHLSSELAKAEKGIFVFKQLENLLMPFYNVTRAHFGSQKSLLLDVYGHTGNVRFRSF